MLASIEVITIKPGSSVYYHISPDTIKETKERRRRIETKAEKGSKKISFFFQSSRPNLFLLLDAHFGRGQSATGRALCQPGDSSSPRAVRVTANIKKRRKQSSSSSLSERGMPRSHRLSAILFIFADGSPEGERKSLLIDKFQDRRPIHHWNHPR